MSSDPIARDKCFTRKLLRPIKRIIGEHLIHEAPPKEDYLHNTDLIVLKLGGGRIACRVRRHKYLARYGDQFTVRETRPSGLSSELTKIVEGWGDYVLYGFCNEAETDLSQWLLGDLDVFRLWFTRELVRGKGIVPGIQQTNGDGSSTFRAFRVTDLPAAFFVARWPDPDDVPFDPPAQRH
jgi:hypothetical protein